MSRCFRNPQLEADALDNVEGGKMSDKIYATAIAYAIHRQSDNPIFGEGTMRVRLDDEAGSFFIVLEAEGKEIRVNLEDLELACKTARKMIQEAEFATLSKTG